MNKLKSLLHKKDKSASTPSNSSPATQTSSSAAPTSGAGTGAGAGTSADAEGVILHTNLGDITIALYKDQTPKTCRNFAQLASSGYYNGVIFHRIIPGFMIQGGDPTGTGRGGESIYGGKFADEFVSSLKHTDKGTMSMANSGPGTNGSQFFITLGPTPHLDGKHTVFGHVVDGMDTVDKLGAVRTNAQDRPVQDVMIVGGDVF
ncbi:hypothetical protein BU16DRAFT_490411 [Lophium mytilinum]|uniref:Peptidyl-prolyl cis-trans isomerase n=1 Tax=Lophium mytilinum TaxID=390894 RepID=A0A6A6QJW8_9PEZI|nr:hypothetical protein BU16DRAFT_490411 [Lophium mytilinum]